jgi:hypothetical protein
MGQSDQVRRHQGGVITCPTFHNVSSGEWRLPGRNDEVIEQKAAPRARRLLRCMSPLLGTKHQVADAFKQCRLSSQLRITEPILHSWPFRRRLRCQHPLCRFDVDERISIEMCRDDIRPLIEDLMKGIVILNVENPNRAPPHASIDLPAYTSCFVLGYPRPERLPRPC